MLAWARRKEQAFKEGPHYNYNFEFIGNRLTGYVAESAFWVNYPEAIYCDTSTHDFLLWKERYDVKSYKSDYAPLPNYGACVTDKDLTERGGTARYYWVTVYSDYSKATLLGWLPYDRFIELAVFKKKGERLGGFTYPIDTWEVPISSLHSPIISAHRPCFLSEIDYIQW